MKALLMKDGAVVACLDVTKPEEVLWMRPAWPGSDLVEILERYVYVRTLPSEEWEFQHVEEAT